MIPVLSAQQNREADAYTMAHEPISPADLMERAAGRCFDYISRHFAKEKPVLLFCGTGNNGGDGLVIARKLPEAGYKVRVFVVRYNDKSSAEFDLNLKKLAGIDITVIREEKHFPLIDKNDMVVDALLGTGLSRPPEGLMADLIQHINSHSAFTIAIDLPSGLYADSCSVIHKDRIINAHLTLSFQVPKLAFFFPENAKHTGEIKILEIGLHRGFLSSCKTTYYVTEPVDVARNIPARKAFSHKGTYGHALLISGSKGKAGAAVLAAHACLRSGVGLLTVQAPRCAHQVLQTVVPEAMLCPEDGDDHVLSVNDWTKYQAMGIGPGLGTNEDTARMLKFVLQEYKGPVVFDADALNILSENKTWLSFLPAGSILTPHPKEFERLFGKTSDDFERLELLKTSAAKYGIHILLKGRYSLLATPGGYIHINTTGNPGMATGGTGDVLTGIITGLLAQGIGPLAAAVSGMWLHGMAGDLALQEESEQSLIASDVIKYLGDAFKEMEKYR